MKSSLKLLAALAFCLTQMCASSSSAQTSARAPAPSIGTSQRPALEAEDLGAWLDGLIPQALAEADIAGAEVTIVANGRIIASRGYGYADLERRTPVVPGVTLFRPGSISKLFTWTAVMQLVEQGELDLDADVNTYLDFEIPAYQDQPITMRQIMTHTTGFEETMRDMVPLNENAAPISLEHYLKNNIPRRIFPPGTMPAYSNYATGLAGYIVQRISGDPFADYVQHHIFDPLGMRNSTFAQPLPAAMNERLSRGYNNVASGQAQPFEIVIAAPAGAMTSTGPDIALFMMAHLNDGAGLMRPETARLMHETIDQQFPGVNSMALGFYQENYGGQRIISHGGDTAWFHSNLSLLLDHNVGVYVSFNSSGASPLDAAMLRIDILNRFVARYFPAEVAPVAEPLPTALTHGAAMIGDFERARRSETNPIYVAYFAGQINIAMLPNGDLVGPGLPTPNGQPMRWREVEPWVWQAVGGHERMGARVDESGRVSAIAFEPFAFAIPFTRAPWWRSKSLLAPLLGLAFAVLLITALSWPLRALSRRAHKIAFPYAGMRALAHRASPLVALSALGYILAWATFIVWLLGSLANASSAGQARSLLTALYGANILLIAAIVGAAFTNFAVWRAPSSWFAKGWALLLLLAVGVVIWFAAAMNFFSFNLDF